MAASDARPIPRKNTAFRVYFPILDNDGDTVTGATGLDSEVSIDGAAFSDCTNEATEIGTSGFYYLDLTSGEMNGDAVVLQVKTTSTNAKTAPIVFYPEELGDLRIDPSTIFATVVEGAHTLTHALRIMLSALAGKASGLGTTTAVFRDLGDTKNRISATVDASGNRSAIGTLDGT